MYNALNDSSLLETLSQSGYDEAVVEKALADITGMDRANKAQESAKGACIAATGARDAAV